MEQHRGRTLGRRNASAPARLRSRSPMRRRSLPYRPSQDRRDIRGDRDARGARRYH